MNSQTLPNCRVISLNIIHLEYLQCNLVQSSLMRKWLSSLLKIWKIQANPSRD